MGDHTDERDLYRPYAEMMRKAASLSRSPEGHGSCQGTGQALAPYIGLMLGFGSGLLEDSQLFARSSEAMKDLIGGHGRPEAAALLIELADRLDPPVRDAGAAYALLMDGDRHQANGDEAANVERWRRSRHDAA
jgi:hypothetical protein